MTSGAAREYPGSETPRAGATHALYRPRHRILLRTQSPHKRKPRQPKPAGSKIRNLFVGTLRGRGQSTSLNSHRIFSCGSPGPRIQSIRNLRAGS